jgi:DNA-binding LacI/PurR family transcriptional regulator
MANCDVISELIEKRIRMGDYALKDIPAEETLAAEVGVGRMTARRAMLRLVDKGVLIRQPNGRLAVNRDDSQGAPRVLHIAVLMPAWQSPFLQRWQAAAAQVAGKFNAIIRRVDFVHWDDPLITDALERFDAVLLYPSADPVPPHVMDRLREHRTLVVLDTDWSKQGIRSIDLVPASQTRDMLEHFAALGHQRIACLNTQPLAMDIPDRIKQWETWMSQRGWTGRLICEPVPAYGDAVARSYEVMTKFLVARKPDFTAMLAVALPAAIGATRAMLDAGIRIGQDVSIGAINGEGLAKYLNPPLTATQVPDIEPFLEVVFEWIQQRKANWDAPMLLQPSSVPLYIGASTGPCPAATEPFGQESSGAARTAHQSH